MPLLPNAGLKPPGGFRRGSARKILPSQTLFVQTQNLNKETGFVSLRGELQYYPTARQITTLIIFTSGGKNKGPSLIFREEFEWAEGRNLKKLKAFLTDAVELQKTLVIQEKIAPSVEDQLSKCNPEQNPMFEYQVCPLCTCFYCTRKGVSP